MMNDDEIDAVIAQHLQPEANDIHYLRRFACAIISAVLAKLTAGVEVPDLRDFAISDRAHIDLIAAFQEYGASQRLAGQQWLPIESAPKDGTVIDLWYVPRTGFHRRVTSVWWAAGLGWRRDDGMLPIDMKFTHWMNPPASPQEQQP